MWCVSLPRRRTVLQSLTVWNRSWRSTHTWAMRPVLQFCPFLFVTCVMYALVHVMAMEVFVRLTVLLVVAFDWCHLFGGCESMSLWFPKQWMINAIKYNNEALVYHNNIHRLHLNIGVDQQKKSCVTGLNLGARQQQPQFIGWVTPSPTDYYKGVNDRRITHPRTYQDEFPIKVKISKLSYRFHLGLVFYKILHWINFPKHVYL